MDIKQVTDKYMYIWWLLKTEVTERLYQNKDEQNLNV